MRRGESCGMDMKRCDVLEARYSVSIQSAYQNYRTSPFSSNRMFRYKMLILNTLLFNAYHLGAVNKET